MSEDEIAKQIVDSAYRIHTRLGPGLLESVYEVCLAHELKRGISVQRQEPISISYDGIKFEEAFRADLIVGGKVIVELEAIETVLPQHKKQLLTYLRLTNKRLGLLINFNAELIKFGIDRIANNLPE